MRRIFCATVVSLTIASISSVSFAFGLGDLTGSKEKSGNDSASVSADSLVKSYVIGTKQVMSADVNLLNAMGLREAAAKEELASKNLTEGATSSGLEDAAKVQTESSKALADAMGAKKVTLTADSKKQYTAGVLDLVKGIKSYIAMSSDVKNFKPSITSIGASANAALYIAKSLPDSITNLKNTLKRSIDFAKENKIEVPGDATSLL